MSVHIALLRAVNVGGTGKLSMSALKMLCGKAGFADVQTYIQSGNVLFRSGLSADDAAKVLDEALARVMDKAPGVTVRSRKQLETIAQNNPFPDAKPNYLTVNFLPGKAPDDALDSLVAPDGEKVHVAGHEIYVHYPNGSGRSKLKLPALKQATSRNLNTVRKLAELAAEMEKQTSETPQCCTGWNSNFTKLRKTRTCSGRLCGSFKAFDKTMPPSITVETMSASWSASSGSRGV